MDELLRRRATADDPCDGFHGSSLKRGGNEDSLRDRRMDAMNQASGIRSRRRGHVLLRHSDPREKEGKKKN